MAMNLEIGNVGCILFGSDTKLKEGDKVADIVKVPSVEEVLKNVDQKTAIIVCSDHGFSSYRRSVHLNTFLVKNDHPQRLKCVVSFSLLTSY